MVKRFKRMSAEHVMKGDIISSQWHAGPGVLVEERQVSQRRLRPLDLGGQDCFLADLHVQEELLARQEEGHAIQSPQSALRVVQQAQKRDRLEGRIGRLGRRDERGHGLATLDGLDVVSSLAKHILPRNDIRLSLYLRHA